jgi:hypothetical protein
MKRRIDAVWLAIAGVVVACSGSDERLGGTTETPLNGTGGSSHSLGAGAASGGGQALPNYPDGFGDPTASHDAAAGTWTGYIENYMPSTNSSDEVTVEFDSLSDGTVTGRVIFGDATAPVPDFSDPRAYFLKHGQSGGIPELDSTLHLFPAESYPFTLVDGSQAGSRVQFTVATDEIWQQYCVQQTPFPYDADAGIYRCVPNQGYAGDSKGCYVGTVGGPRVDCVKLAMCAVFADGPCTCNAASCGVGEGGLHFDISMQGDRMDGSTASPGTAGYNVHLTKL